MISILGAILFGVVAILTSLVTFGLPLGEYTLGGKYKVLPPKFRIASGISFFVQLFAVVIILQTGRIIDIGISHSVSRGICFFFAAFLSLNTIINFLSNSRKEKFVMTPLSTVAAICFWITAINV